MSVHKRLVLIAAIAAMVSIGSTTTAQAQHRYRRAPVRVVVAPYYSPFLYSGWGYDPWFGDAQWGGVYGPYSPYRHYNVDPGGSVKLEVKPKQAEVYVDGYYAGVVDDFDGIFQRLRIEPGEHELSLYLEGYRTVHQKVYLTPDNTFKLKYDMEKLGGGEQPEPRPQPLYPPQSAGPGGPGGQQPYYPPTQQAPRGPMGRRAPAPQPLPPGARDPRDARPSDASAYGTLSVRIQPGSADVIVDGEKWRGPEGQERIFIELPEGRHTVEVQKQGFRTYVTEIDVRRGETTPLNVSLRNQEDR